MITVSIIRNQTARSNCKNGKRGAVAPLLNFQTKTATSPVYKSETEENGADGLVPDCSLMFGVRYAGVFYARSALPPIRPKAPTRRWGYSARAERGRGFATVRDARTFFHPRPRSTGESGVRPLTGAGFFVRCRGLLAPVRWAGSNTRAYCAGVLRWWPRFALPRRSTWPLIYYKRPYTALGGAPRGGAPSPAPRLPAPPHKCAGFCGGLLWRAFARLAANSATARARDMHRSLVARPVRALLAWLSLLARLSAPMPPDGRLGGSPVAPAPRARALPVAPLPSAPSLPLPLGRASHAPHYSAGSIRGHRIFIILSHR